MPVEDYVRSFESLRASLEDLPQGEPAFVRPLAAVTLRARLQRRDLRDETIELSHAIAASMPREVPPPPQDWTNAAHAIFGELVRRQPCTMCGVKPGFVPCPACIGAGCPECTDAGWLKCTTCDGRCEVLIATIRHVEDRDVTIRHTFLPTTTLAMEDALLGRLLEDEPDECLRFDVDLREGNAPYREVPGDFNGGGLFHDHAFMGAIDRARETVTRIAGHHWVREEVRAYARPFLWVGWNTESEPPVRNIAIVPDPRAVYLLRA